MYLYLNIYIFSPLTLPLHIFLSLALRKFVLCVPSSCSYCLSFFELISSVLQFLCLIQFHVLLWSHCILVLLLCYLSLVFHLDFQVVPCVLVCLSSYFCSCYSYICIFSLFFPLVSCCVPNPVVSNYLHPHCVFKFLCSLCLLSDCCVFCLFVSLFPGLFLFVSIILSLYS